MCCTQLGGHIERIRTHGPAHHSHDGRIAAPCRLYNLLHDKACISYPSTRIITSAGVCNKQANLYTIRKLIAAVVVLFLSNIRPLKAMTSSAQEIARKNRTNDQGKVRMVRVQYTLIFLVNECLGII